MIITLQSDDQSVTWLAMVHAIRFSTNSVRVWNLVVLESYVPKSYVEILLVIWHHLAAGMINYESFIEARAMKAYFFLD